MYAVLKTGGKQYRVSPGDRLKIEKIPGDVGDSVRFEEILMIGGAEEIKVGTPHISGASVSAKIVEQARSKKVEVYKVKRRKGHRRKHGHRQSFTRVEITGIEA